MMRSLPHSCSTSNFSATKIPAKNLVPDHPGRMNFHSDGPVRSVSVMFNAICIVQAAQLIFQAIYHANLYTSLLMTAFFGPLGRSLAEKIGGEIALEMAKIVV